MNKMIRTVLTGSCLGLLLMSACALPLLQQATSTPVSTPTPAPLPLGTRGAYQVGMRQFKAVDARRANREVKFTVWYPAVLPAGNTSNSPVLDAPPNRDNAPYPVIVSSSKLAYILVPYVVSHGFTWVGVDGIDYYMAMNEQMLSQPLDILFGLERIAAAPPKGLEGMFDADHAGAIGYSFDGYNTLAMSGARIDAAFYMAQCPTPDPASAALYANRMSAFSCDPALKWDEFTAGAGGVISTSKEELWQPLTDARIRAVMPMAGEGWWLFGARGLAAVDRPVLMIVGTDDELYAENALIFQHLGTPDKTLISFVGQGHMTIYSDDMISRMAHFAVAFFGYHLRGQTDMAQYFSKEFVAGQSGLAWGVYTDK